MRKTKKIIASALVASTVLTTCCTPVLAAEVVGEAENKTVVETADAVDDIKDVEGGGAMTEEKEDIKNMNFEKSVVLADKIAEKEKGNMMFSPTSLNFALGMLAEGAEGETKSVIADYLGKEDFGEFAKSYTESIKNYNTTVEDEQLGYKQKLKIANALWADNKLPLKASFLDAVSAAFNASLTNADFSQSEEVSRMINEWSDENTEHLIPEIVNPGDVEGSDLVLTNSLYFESPWARKAWDEEPEKSVFHGADAEEDVTMMTTEGDMYYENDKATAFSRGYQNGMAFIGILPKDEGEFSLESLDIDGLLASEPEFSAVNCRMPSSLDFTTSAYLAETLSDLGLENIFSGQANFSGISEVPTVVSEIIQKTNLQLDKNGTKAAAVTAVIMERMSLPIEPDPALVKEVNLDRPFAFLIYDEQNEEVLFMGKIMTTQNK